MYLITTIIIINHLSITLVCISSPQILTHSNQP